MVENLNQPKVNDVVLGGQSKEPVTPAVLGGLSGVKLRLARFTYQTLSVNQKGIEIKRNQKLAQFFPEDLGNQISLEMVAIPGGTFLMGAPITEAESSDNERPQHLVRVKPFAMGKYPVTQAQWQAVAAFPKVNQSLDPNPSRFQGANHPVEGVSWYDAVEFCARLSRKTGRDYRLPSEAEWEYACRAGTTTPFHCGKTMTPEIANYCCGSEGTYLAQTTPVGSLEANAFGLYDMHGNVWEWCADPWHISYEDRPIDGSVWSGVSTNNCQFRLRRGGSYSDRPEICRSAFRNLFAPGVRYNVNGFRVACSSISHLISSPPNYPS